MHQLGIPCGMPQHIIAEMTGVHLVFHLLEHEWMVARFAQLREHISETTNASLDPFTIHDRDLVVFDQLLVQLRLQG